MEFFMLWSSSRYYGFHRVDEKMIVDVSGMLVIEHVEQASPDRILAHAWEPVQKDDPPSG
jgi:hypothetical protein